MKTDSTYLAPFFFTDLDQSLRPRGSRDPLGTEMIWAAAGRKLVGNLTTVTRELDNFIIALLGFHLCRNDEGQADWKRFQRFEQVTGHARCRVQKSDGVLGRRKIESQSESRVIHLGEKRTAAILENQRQAGMWGLYSSALTASGLLHADRSVTGDGEEIVKRLLGGRSPDWLDKVWIAPQLSVEEMAPVMEWTKATLKQRRARRDLAARLLCGGGMAPPLQATLLDHGLAFLRSRPRHRGSRAFLQYLIAHAPDDLRQFATKLLQLDNVLILADACFGALLGYHGTKRKDLAQRLDVLLSWPGRRQLAVPEIADLGKGETGKRVAPLSSFSRWVAVGDLASACDELLRHHTAVMDQRAGAAWCAWEEDGLKVITSDTAAPLPTVDDLQGNFAEWSAKKSKGFFLWSFLSVLEQSGLAEVVKEAA